MAQNPFYTQPQPQALLMISPKGDTFQKAMGLGLF